MGEKELNTHQSIIETIKQLDANFKLQGGGVEPIKKLGIFRNTVTDKSDLKTQTEEQTSGQDIDKYPNRTISRQFPVAITADTTFEVTNNCYKMYSNKQGNNHNLPNESINSSKIVTGTKPPYHIADESVSNLSIWRITDRMILIGHCWKNNTERFSKNNNINEMNNYLENTFGNNFMVYSFQSSTEPRRFKRSICYNNITFNLEKCLEIARTTKCWFTVNRDGIIVIELHKNVLDIIMLFVSTILSYNNLYTSAEYAYTYLIKNYKNIFDPSETVLRYTKYFDQLPSLHQSINPKCFNRDRSKAIIKSYNQPARIYNFRGLLHG